MKNMTGLFMKNSTKIRIIKNLSKKYSFTNLKGKNSTV